MKRLLSALLFTAAMGFAAEYKITLRTGTVSSYALTIQHPASGSIKDTRIPKIAVGCLGGGCRIRVERNGAAASTTLDNALVKGANRKITVAPLFNVFKASNSTGGVEIFDDDLPSSGSYPLSNLGNLVLSGLGTTENYTIFVTFHSGTGVVKFNINIQD